MHLFNVEDHSYRVHNNNKNINGYNLQYISECYDKNCLYSRENTIIRKKYEDLISKKISTKNGVSILFYGSWLLYQELCICIRNLDRIREIHFTDYGYMNLKKNHLCFLALKEFKFIISKPGLNIYIHTNPDFLINSSFCKKRFDIVCGIDIDYQFGIQNNRPIMQSISLNTLKKDGIMIVSQNNLDLIDISQYQIVSNKLQMIYTTEYIKGEFYVFHKLMYYLKYLFPIMSIYFIFVSNLNKSKIFGITCFCFSIYNFFFTPKRRIFPLNKIIRSQ